MPPGSPDHMRRIRLAGLAARRAQAELRAVILRQVIVKIRAEGVTSFFGIAARLNAAGYSAPRGGRWTATQAKRLLARLDGAVPAGKG